MYHCKSKCSCPTKFDPTKPVQLSDGRKARIVATDCGFKSTNNKKCYPIVAIVESHLFGETVLRFTEDGMFSEKLRLVNIPNVDEEIRTFAPECTAYYLSQPRSLDDAKSIIKEHPNWSALKFIYTDDELTSVEILRL